MASTVNKNGNESRQRLLYLEKSVNLLEAKIVNPQEIPLNGSGAAIFQEQSSCLSVLVPMGLLRHWKKRKGADTAQVWLLRMDGTQVPQCAQPFVFSMGMPGDYARDYQFHTFPKIPPDELASIVVSFQGRLYCHQIRKTGER